MHSITPILRRIARRGRSPTDPGDAGPDLEEATSLWGAVLDGGLPELELGALLATLSAAGETPEELLGLHGALARRSACLEVEAGPRVLSIPVYGILAGEAVLAVLIALFLRRLEVPVLLHGMLDAPSGPSVPALLRELGILPSATLVEAESRLATEGIAFVPVQLLSPALATVLALRTRLGTMNAAHLVAQAMAPAGGKSLRLAACVRGQRGERMPALLTDTGPDALCLCWPDGCAGADLACQPRVTWLHEGREQVVFEASPTKRGDGPTLPPAGQLLGWMRAVVSRQVPAPSSLVNIATACVHAARGAGNFAQARAVVALQSGRQAA